MIVARRRFNDRQNFIFQCAIWAKFARITEFADFRFQIVHFFIFLINMQLCAFYSCLCLILCLRHFIATVYYLFNILNCRLNVPNVP